MPVAPETQDEPAAVWALEQTLVAGAPCESGPVAARPALPTVGLEPAEVPVAPSGPGVAPWVLLGTGLALGGVLAYIDAVAEPTRTALEDAARRGDAKAYARAYDDFQFRRQAARGVAIGGAAAVVGGLLWIVLGRDTDPVQTRPWITTEGLGVGGRF